MFIKLILLALIVATAYAVQAGDECVDYHNQLRALHGVAQLKKASFALKDYNSYRPYEITRLGGRSIRDRGQGKMYGENVFEGQGQNYSCKEAIQSWYDENGSKFAQVVWKDATEVACHTTKTIDGEFTMVIVSIMIQ